MEENQNSEQFNVSGKNKKGLGPVKGTLLALLIVFLICTLGLLIRMIVADDGDYFKPIKQICGIEDEDEEEGKSKKKTSKNDVEEDDDDYDDDEDEIKTSNKKGSSGKSALKATGKYALLSDDVEDKGVKHYRLTVDVGDVFGLAMASLNSMSSDSYSSSSSSSSKKSTTSTKSSSYNEDEGLLSELEGLEDVLGTATDSLDDIADLMDGEMYFDVYFEGNEIVQVVFGFDYAKFLENLYEESAEDLEDEGIESVDDLAEMLVEEFDEVLDKDMLYDMIMEEADSDSIAKLNKYGIKEKDIKDLIDFNNEKGIIEVYINGTTKLKALLSMALESKDFQEGIKDMEKETGVEVDEDNVIESLIKMVNKSSDEIEDELGFDFKFVEVK